MITSMSSVFTRTHRLRLIVWSVAVAVVVAFFVCWAPFHTQRLLVIFVAQPWSAGFVDFMHVSFYMSGVLYYTSSVINPILYHTMSLKFRRAFKNTILSPCRADGRRRGSAFVGYKFCRGHVELDSDASVSRLRQKDKAANNKSNGGYPAGGVVTDSRSQSRSHSSGRGANSNRVLSNIADEPISYSQSDSKVKGVLTPRIAYTHFAFQGRPYHSYT